jgi:hypothetical protein
MYKAKGFTELSEPVEDEVSGDECGWQCKGCDSPAFEYYGAWIEKSGEFGDDRDVVECTGCGTTAEIKEK